MAEASREQTEEARPTRNAMELTFNRSTTPDGASNSSLSLKIADNWVAVGAFGTVSLVGLGLSTLLYKHPKLLTETVKFAWEAKNRVVKKIKRGSILVELHCYTKESFLSFMEDFETKKVKQRLEQEFQKVGITFKLELEVSIINANEVYEKLDQIRKLEQVTSHEEVEGAKPASQVAEMTSHLSLASRAASSTVQETLSDTKLWTKTLEMSAASTTDNNDPPETSVTLVKAEDCLEGLIPSLDWLDVDFPMDILWLVAKDCEKMSCLTYLKPSLYKSYHKHIGHVYFGDMGKYEEMKLKIAVIQCSEDAASPGSSIDAVKNVVAVLNPKAVFFVGFCGSLNHKKVKLGDVVVSATLRTFPPLERMEGIIQEPGIRVPLKTKTANLITHAGDGWTAPLKEQGQLDVKVHHDGVFIGGVEFLDSKELTKLFPNAIAFEMESALLSAAHHLDVECIVVKGVSEFMDGEKSKTDSWRRFASTMAASVAAHMLSEPIVFKDWPHYKMGASASEQSLTSKRKSPRASGTEATKRYK